MTRLISVLVFVKLFIFFYKAHSKQLFRHFNQYVKKKYIYYLIIEKYPYFLVAPCWPVQVGTPAVAGRQSVLDLFKAALASLATFSASFSTMT